MLKSWHFSDNLIAVVSQCHNFKYDHIGDADLVNLVQVAMLQGGYVIDEQASNDWSSVPSFSKLGMATDVNILHIKENQQKLDNARKVLNV